MKAMVIDLGDRAKDRVTGFSGIVVAKTVWLNGCWRLTLQPEDVDKDGKPREPQTFDSLQLDLIAAGAVPSGNREEQPKPSRGVLRATGGPRPDIGRPKDITR